MSERKINLFLGKGVSKQPAAQKELPPRSRPVTLFAYGGIMNQSLVGGRGIRAQAIGVAKLPGHKLSFHGYTVVWDGAEETAVEAAGHDLYGVLYKLGGTEADRLEAAHGVRLNGTGDYFHYPVEVITMDGETVSAVMFRKAALRDQRLPSEPYLRTIIEGAKSHGLPEEYIAELAKTPTVPAGYPVPLWPKSGPSLPVEDPCDC